MLCLRCFPQLLKTCPPSLLRWLNRSCHSRLCLAALSTKWINSKTTSITMTACLSRLSHSVPTDHYINCNHHDARRTEWSWRSIESLVVTCLVLTGHLRIGVPLNGPSKIDVCLPTPYEWRFENLPIGPNSPALKLLNNCSFSCCFFHTPVFLLSIELSEMDADIYYAHFSSFPDLLVDSYYHERYSGYVWCLSSS